jgi:hypothetical protein
VLQQHAVAADAAAVSLQQRCSGGADAERQPAHRSMQQLTGMKQRAESAAAVKLWAGSCGPAAQSFTRLFWPATTAQPRMEEMMQRHDRRTRSGAETMDGRDDNAPVGAHSARGAISRHA